MYRTRSRSSLPQQGIGAPWVSMTRKGGVVRIEASMCPGTTGVELSDRACRTLSAFLTAYHEAHGLDPSADYFHPSRDLTTVFVGVGAGGVTVDVLPEDAERIGGCLAAFVTDPTNHDPVDGGETFVTAFRGSLATATVRTWTEKDARSAVEQARKAVEAKFPELIADPLGTIQGS